MGIGIWHKFALTGGGATALDGIATASIADSDVCHVYAAGKYYYMVFDADATDAESSPNVIRPDDYSTAGVWKIGGSPYGDVQAQPEIVAGLPITGGVTGGTITRASNTTLTITPVTCLDSGLTTKLYTSTNTTFTVPHTGSIAANTIYHIYIVKLISGGTFEFRTYTTETAVASDAAIDKYRWVGICFTNGSSVLINTIQKNDTLQFFDTYSTGNLPTSGTVSWASIVPADRCCQYTLSFTVAAAQSATATSLSGGPAIVGGTNGSFYFSTLETGCTGSASVACAMRLISIRLKR